MIQIKENAIFIADSHYPHHGDDLFVLLQKIEKQEIKTSQLFLMGDNFDLLFGYNDYIQTFSAPAIKLLQELSKTLEIHYFEGNHDFCLQEIFPNIQVYTREMQPLMCTLGDKKVALSHGDKYATGLGYNLYSKVLRNKITLVLLRPFEKVIIKHRMKKLSFKNICHDFYDFEQKVKNILLHYSDADIVIEGHFHQAKIQGKYISLPSQACQNKIAIVSKGKLLFKAF